MLILINSGRFYPLIGGMETVAIQLATNFVRLGHEVTLITSTESACQADDYQFPFKVIRRPTIVENFKWARRASAILHNSISLRALFPDILFYRKLFVMHQTWYSKGNFRETISAAMKLKVCHLVNNVSISGAIEKHIPKKGVIIPNPYNSELFVTIAAISKSRDLVFLGRLVSDKGCDLLLKALHQLNTKGIFLELTIIGSGPEKESLKDLCNKLELDKQVVFLEKRGSQLVEELNRHRIMIIPSLWEEPFGIVALEGLACGCLVIGSGKGGLVDAIGPGGQTFANGNVDELVSCIEYTIAHETELRDRKADLISEHLRKHRAEEVSMQYLQYFQRCRA